MFRSMDLMGGNGLTSPEPTSSHTDFVWISCGTATYPRTKKKKYPLWGTYSFFKKEESHSSLDSIILWNGGALYLSLQSSTAKNVPIGRSWQHHFPLPGQSKQTLIFHSLNKENTHAELVDYVSNLSHSKELVDGLYRSIFSLKKNLQTVSDLSHWIGITPELNY